MSVWPPGTTKVDSPMSGLPLIQSRSVGNQVRLSVKAKKTGAYYLELKVVKKSREPVSYQLAAAKS